MEPDEYQYWPLPVVPPERQTVLEKSVIHFFETAYREGFKPHHRGGGNYGASSQNRGGLIFVRGKDKWEAVLSGSQEGTLSAHIKGFDYAAAAVLAWLRGTSIATTLDEVRPHLIVDRGKGGYTLYERGS